LHIATIALHIAHCHIAATRILKDALDNGTKYSMAEIQKFDTEDFKTMTEEIALLDRGTMLP
jgi:hypothetical protein|tara:strand:+ start:42 stop:227 length:186 start_codon:yes stop_codon:yes gene_type:complete